MEEKNQKKSKCFYLKIIWQNKMNPGALCRQDHAHVFYLKKVLCQNNPHKKLFQNKCTPKQDKAQLTYFYPY